MIPINRPANPPAILSNRGRAETNKLCSMYDVKSADYDSGALKLPTANSKIYGNKSVKDSLKACQHNKCCYSEARFIQELITVEHYRPKGAIGTKGTSKKQYPGYYWLAYEWTNLLLCKFRINSSKKDYFPLLIEQDRARNHHDNIGLERPVIIDPASEDPREHIKFHNEEPIGLTERGRRTVKLLLRHDDLDEGRRKRFQFLDSLKSIYNAPTIIGNDQEKLVRIKQILDEAIRPDAEYSSMAIDLLKNSNPMLSPKTPSTTG